MGLALNMLAELEGTPISRTQFHRMLKNPIYAGWILQFGEKHKGYFESIVSEELFDKVQYVLTYRKRRNHHYLTEHPDFPLRRFVNLN